MTDLQALISNLKHAAWNKETVTIGGGEFGPDILAKAAAALAFSTLEGGSSEHRVIEWPQKGGEKWLVKVNATDGSYFPLCTLAQAEAAPELQEITERFLGIRRPNVTWTKAETERSMISLEEQACAAITKAKGTA